MPKVVEGEGPLDAKMMFLGEAPGREEEVRGRPFVGSAGRLMNSMFANARIDRKLCRIDNVMHTRPAGNDFRHFYIDSGKREPSLELTRGWHRIRASVRSIRPRVCVCFGEESMRALCGTRGIGKWRGFVQEFEGVKVIGAYHPAGILRQYKNRPVTELDLRKALRESKSREFFDPPYEFNTSPAFEQVMEFLARDDTPRVAFDIETTKFEHRMLVRTLSLSWASFKAINIPFMSCGTGARMTNGGKTLFVPLGSGAFNSYWPEHEEIILLRELRHWFNSGREFIAQNYPFDSSILAWEFGIVIRELYMDTMVGSHLCYPEMPKSLDFLISIHTRNPRYSVHDASVDEEEWSYCCKDSCNTWEIHKPIEEELKEKNLWGFYQGKVLPYMIALTRAQNRGCDIDKIVRKEERDKRLLIMYVAAKGLEKVLKYPLNPASSKQVQDLLYTRLGLPMKRHRKTHSPTVDEEALKDLRRRYPKHKALIDTILEYRHAQKTIGTILSAELRPSDDRMEWTYNVSGTVNGRLSSSGTLWDTGINVQQVDKSSIRRIFIPPKGYGMVRVDLSQAEARVVAWRGKMMELIKRFQDPSFDIHRWNASAIFNVEECDVTNAMRKPAKAGVHGGNYGLGPRKASKIYDVPFQMAKRAIDVYKRRVPVERWWKEIQEEVIGTRMLTNPFGRSRLFMGRLDNELFRSAYSCIPQGTVADIIMEVFTRLDVELEEVGGYPLIQAHDEIVSCVPLNRMERGVEIIQRAFDVPVKFDGVDVPLVIPIELSVGANWWGEEERKDKNHG